MNGRAVVAALLGAAWTIGVVGQPSPPPSTSRTRPLPPLVVPEPTESPAAVPRQVARAVAEGNEALRSGRPADALRRYSDAQVLAPELPEVEYNRGLAALIGGRLDEALESFELAGELAKRPVGEGRAVPSRVADDSRFNAAHAALRGDDLPGAALRWAEVVASDEQAADARRNLELVLRLQDVPPEQSSSQQESSDDQEEPQDDPQPQEQQEPQQPSGSDDERDEPPDDPAEQPERPEDEQEPPERSDPREGEGEAPPREPRPDEPSESPEEGMSRQAAEQLLEALAEEEKRGMEARMERESSRRLRAPGGKDW